MRTKRVYNWLTLAALAVLAAAVCVVPMVVGATGTVTQYAAPEQIERPNATLWPNYYEGRAGSDAVQRMDLTCTCDTATSTISQAILLSDAATEAVFNCRLLAVITSSTANMTTNWDFELRNEFGSDLLYYGSTAYGHDRETSRAQTLILQYEPAVRGPLTVYCENTTGTFRLTLLYQSEN